MPTLPAKPSMSWGSPGGGFLPQATMLEDSLDDLSLGRFDKRYDLHNAAAFGAGQRIDLIHAFDEHGPGCDCNEGPVYQKPCSQRLGHLSEALTLFTHAPWSYWNTSRSSELGASPWVGCAG